jgi:hypothetical protein
MASNPTPVDIDRHAITTDRAYLSPEVHVNNVWVSNSSNGLQQTLNSDEIEAYEK